jgi:hypothetical protein
MFARQALIRGLAALALLPALASGCASATTAPSLSKNQLSTIAHACHEAAPKVARSLNAARQTLTTRGLDGASAKLVQDVGSLAALVASQSSKLPDCSGLIHLLTRRLEQPAPTARPATKLPATPWTPESIETR